MPDGMVDLALRHVLAPLKPSNQLVDLDDLHLAQCLVIAHGLPRLAGESLFGGFQLGDFGLDAWLLGTWIFGKGGANY